MSLKQIPDDQLPPDQEPAPVTDVRCKLTRGDLINHSDIIAMYQESETEILRKYRIDIVGWGGQMRRTENAVNNRTKIIERAHDAGVRLHAVDVAMLQEGGRFVVCDGDRQNGDINLFWDLRKDNQGTIEKLGNMGIDLTAHTVLDINGNWIGVPWLRDRWRIPMPSVFDPQARRWYRDHFDAIARTGLTALHIDEPAMGSYGLRVQQPGDFSDHAVRAFRQWLKNRPQDLLQKAGVDDPDSFDYRQFVLDHGGEPRKAPLWREFVRFQLFSTVDFLRDLVGRLRDKAGKHIPLSMNAKASDWIKLPFLQLQDFMTTEVPHRAKSRQVPDAPALTYTLGDAFHQPVASTAHGHDWYEMRTDQHPILVSAWMSMGYAFGHHLMVPCKAWVMDPVKGSGTYRPNTDHYACLVRFIKSISYLLDGYGPVSTTAVVISCDAIQHDKRRLQQLVVNLNNGGIPFHFAVEGNDLLDRRVSEDDIAHSSAVVVALPAYLSNDAMSRVQKLSGDLPTVPWYGAGLPKGLPRPIEVEGAEGVWALPRMAPEQSESPVVLHLLNRDYNADARRMESKGPFTVRLDPALFHGRQFEKAILHSPTLFEKLPEDESRCHEARQLNLKQPDDGAIEFQVPDVGVWGVVELRTD